MLLHRKALLAVSAILTLGSISLSAGYAIYLRTDSYRQLVSDVVSAHLKMPTEIGRIEPLSRNQRAFTDIGVWLPQRKSEVFSCRRALWSTFVRDGGRWNALSLEDGWLLLGTGDFKREDYDRMLRSSLGVDFKRLRLERIELSDMDILWRQDGFELRVEDSAGEATFDADGLGRASLSAENLNGVPTDEPIHIRALFTPGASMTVHHVALTVPRVPLTTLGLEGLLDSAPTSGWFDGVVTYRRGYEGGQPVLSLRGAVGDARLEELTQRVIGGPFTGKVDVDVTEASATREGLQSLIFSGSLSDIHLGELAPLLNEPDLAGTLDLKVHQARYRDGHIQHLSASADAADLSLAAITRMIGKGVVTGRLRVTINSVLIVDDTLRWAEIDLEAVPPEGGVGTIDRDVILYAADKLLGVDLGSVVDYLPENVEYARMGCKLLVDRNGLTVRGSHGSNGNTVLTVRLLGRELGLIKAPKETFPVADIVAWLREHAAGYDVDRILEWWKSRESPEGS